MGFKELYPGVPQSSVRDAICPGFLRVIQDRTPIPVAARSKAWVCGSSLAGIVGSNPTGERGWEWMSLARVVCCQVEDPASG